jgi:DNA-binding NarL/FixJ family response regulator
MSPHLQSKRSMFGIDPRSMMKLPIIVADDNERVLLTLVSALSPDFEVIATATDGRSALERIQDLQPAVAVLDLNMPELNGLEVTKEIVRQHLGSSVVICSIESDPELIAAAQHSGALGYVVKSRLNRDLVSAVKSAACGESFISCL